MEPEEDPKKDRHYIYFTRDETEAVLKGHAKHKGKPHVWVAIKNDPEFAEVLKARSNHDIRYKFRNLSKPEKTRPKEPETTEPPSAGLINYGVGAGLINYGLTCYLNTALQTLFHLRSFREAVLLMCPKPKTVPAALKSIFRNLVIAHGHVGTRDLMESDWAPFVIGDQNDIWEFQVELFKRLPELQEKIQSLFEGQFITYMEYTHTEVPPSQKTEAFRNIPLDVLGCSDVYASLDKFVAEEAIQDFKTENYGVQAALKKGLFCLLPPVLSFQLKRFDTDMNKVNDEYSFPLELDLGKYMTKDAKDADPEVTNLYDLYSVLVHSGSLKSGHYFSYIRSRLPDKQWYKFNDDIVSVASQSEVNAEFGSVNSEQSACGLIYIRKSSIPEVMMCRQPEETASLNSGRLIFKHSKSEGDLIAHTEFTVPSGTSVEKITNQIRKTIVLSHKDLRIYQVKNNIISKVYPATAVLFFKSRSIELRAQEVPEEERSFTHTEWLIFAHHFRRINGSVETFGEPFFLVISKTDNLETVKRRIQKKIPEKVSKLKFAAVNILSSKTVNIDENTDIFSTFNNVSHLQLRLEHEQGLNDNVQESARVPDELQVSASEVQDRLLLVHNPAKANEEAAPDKKEAEANKKRHLNVVFIGQVVSAIGDEISTLGRESTVRRAHLETERTRFTIIFGTPDDKSYITDMISGAYSADLGVLVISAREDEFVETAERFLLVKSLGLSKLIVVVSKMDDPTVKWCPKRYKEILEKMGECVASCGFKDAGFFPISGVINFERMEERVCQWEKDAPSLVEIFEQTELPDMLEDEAQ